MRTAKARPASLVVSVGAAGAIPASAPVAHVGVAMKDRALGERMVRAVAKALQVAGRTARPALPVVRVRSRKGVARLGPAIAGALVVVPVTSKNLRRLVDLVKALRAAGAAGVQLAWDGANPPRPTAERHVFAALEHARATPKEAPVLLAVSEDVAEALLILTAP